MEPLIQIENIKEAIFLRRPSKLNKSPFVGDILIDNEEKIVHLPSMDMGGKCIQNTKILVKKSKNSGKIGKYGKPTCDYISQAIFVNEYENNQQDILVGAHPKLGETIASKLFKVGSVFEPISNLKIINQKREVSKIANCNMRSDFLLQLEDNSHLLIEVKTIVDTDYNPVFKEKYQNCNKTIFYNQTEGQYQRSAIFPWGRGNQKGPDGEKVVSARAIKHVMELTDIAKGLKKDENIHNITPMVVFVVVREDVEKFKPNQQACPSFAKYLKIADESGVKLLALKVNLSYQNNCININYLNKIPIEL